MRLGSWLQIVTPFTDPLRNSYVARDTPHGGIERRGIHRRLEKLRRAIGVEVSLELATKSHQNIARARPVYPIEIEADAARFRTM